MSTTTLSSPPSAAEAAPPQPVDAGSSPAPGIPRGVWLAFIVVIISSVMDLLDSTIAQTAAPAIRRDLGGS